MDTLQESPTEATTILWRGAFLDGDLVLGISPDVPNTVFYSILAADIDSEGFISLDPLTIPTTLKGLVDFIIEFLTEKYLTVVVEDKNEYISSGGSLN